MKVLFVHPSCLMYSELFLRLEPLGLERVAQAARLAGHEVRLFDLQVFDRQDYLRELQEFRPQTVGFSLSFLANVPEVLDLAKETKRLLPDCFVFAGGHSASFIPQELLAHARGALDCIVRGEGEPIAPLLLEAIPDGGIERLPGIVTADAVGPPPMMLHDLDRTLPARDLARRRHKYFIGVLDPCASIEFTRGCPWDCSFCSAWTFYGRSYRKISPEVIGEDLTRMQEPNAFIVDDVAFIHPEDGMAIGREIERRGIRKQYYLETRCDVLLRNQEIFAYWKRLGLRYMFLGLEALDEEGLKAIRKRATPSDNFKALEVARTMGFTVALNIIADSGWDEERFRIIREWAAGVPEIVHLTVNTPYPGTETWLTESRRLTSLDYRLFDVQHAVLPTTLPLKRFYEELVKTQAVLNRKHLGWAAVRGTFATASRLLLQGQTNFVRMLWKFSQVYNPDRQYGDHLKEVKYTLTPPPDKQEVKPTPAKLFVHAPGAAEHRRAQADVAMFQQAEKEKVQ
ncbi:MAG: hopanoid C-3 methylase HpnR [Candidatus Methylomirabilis sp.]|nr:hopanoid C-3 methylase HpnR [Candidatus Methylomirabilis sp.]